VGAKFEDLVVVDPDTLETPVAIEQTMIEHAHRSLFHWHKLAIHPD
jgi:hypothetical protein